MAIIRETLTTGGMRSRDTIIQNSAAALGYARCGKRVREILDNAIRTATRRGILTKMESGDYRLTPGTIEEWDRSFLKTQFLAAIGRGWVEEEEAIRAFARHLGYRRTREPLPTIARSLITSLARASSLEKSAGSLRRL